MDWTLKHNGEVIPIEIAQAIISNITTDENGATYEFTPQISVIYGGERIYVEAVDMMEGCYFESYFDVPRDNRPEPDYDCSTLPDSSYIKTPGNINERVTCEKESVVITGNYIEHVDRYENDTDLKCDCKHVEGDFTRTVTRVIQLDRDGNIGGTRDKVYTGWIDDEVQYTITQTPCQDCREDSTTYSDSTEPYQTVNIDCSAQNVTVTGNIKYTKRKVTIVDGQCIANETTGLSSVTVTTSVTKNTTGAEKRTTVRVPVQGAGGARLIFTLIQAACPACEDEIVYGTSPLVTKTVDCSEQNVSLTGSVPYTSYTKEYDTSTSQCVVVSTTTGTSAKTISVHVSKNEGNTTIEHTGTTNHVRYKITQESCGWVEPDLFDYVFSDGTSGPNPQGDSEEKKIVGICVIPATHTPDGTARIMSLHTVGYLGEIQYGGGSPWTPSTYETLMNTQYTGVPSITTASITTVDGGTFNDVRENGYLPSTFDINNLFTGLTVYGRTERYTTNSDTNNKCIASPFKQNGSRNSNFKVNDTLMNDYGGYENTQEIITNLGYEDRENAAWNAKAYAERSDYQQALSNYESYLPSAAELAYVLVQMKEINQKMTEPASSKFWRAPISMASTISNMSYLWTSDEYNETLAWSIRDYDGEVRPRAKNGQGSPMIRPFLKWKG